MSAAKKMSRNGALRTSDRCIAAIKEMETYIAWARHLPADRPDVFTGGWGETEGVLEGQYFSPEYAEYRLRNRLSRAIEPVIAKLVDPPLALSQFDALVSLIYNIGCGAFLNSTLLKKLGNGDFVGAAAEFARWNQSNGKVQPGLISRRRREMNWFAETFTVEQRAALEKLLEPEHKL